MQVGLSQNRGPDALRKLDSDNLQAKIDRQDSGH